MKLYFFQWQPYIACTYGNHQVSPRAFALASRDTVNLRRIDLESVKGKSQLSIQLSNLDTLKIFAGAFRRPVLMISSDWRFWASALLITPAKVTVCPSMLTRTWG